MVCQSKQTKASQNRHDQAILRFEGNIELLGCKAKPNRSKVALDQDYDSPKS